MTYVNDVILATPTASPYAVWPLQDASGNPAELQGNGPALAQFGGITYQVTGPTINGESTYGIRLDTDILYRSAGYLNGSSSGFTVSGWTKMASSASVNRMVESYSTGQGTWGCRKTTTDQMDARTLQSTDAIHGQAITSASTVPDDAWVWWAARYDASGGVLRAYIDTTTADDTSFVGSWKMDGTPSFVVGTFGQVSTHAFLSFWQVPLTDDEMISLRTGVPLGQTLLPDADTATTGWSTAPLYSKVDAADGTVITATAS